MINMTHRASLMVLMVGAMLFACRDNDSPSNLARQANLEQTVKDNQQIIAISSEIAGMADGALEAEGLMSGRESTGGRIAHEGDGACLPAINGNFEFSTTPDSVVISGTFTLDFGAGQICKDNDSTQMRSGRITDEFRIVLTRLGKLIQASHKITFEGFVNDGARLNGTLIAMKAAGASSSIEFQGMSIDFDDETSVSWDGSLHSTIDNGGTLTREDDTKTVTGQISGTNREGISFSSVITEDIVFKNSCSRRKPVDGTIQLTIGLMTSTIDFGDGTCDNVFTITAEGTTEEHQF